MHRVPPRRAALALVLAILVALALAGCGGGGSTDTGSGTGGTLTQGGRGGETEGVEQVDATARSAESFVESIGVNVHTYYTGDAYENFGLTLQRLQELGIHHVRQNLVTDEPPEYEQLNALAAAGIHSTLILGGPENGLDGLEALLDTIERHLLGTVDAVEGPNELDVSEFESEWPALDTEYQKALWEGVKNRPKLASIPVLGPSVAWRRHYVSAPDLSRYLDYGNIHSYPGGEPPERELEAWLAAARAMSGSKPVMATETGYHTAVDSDGEHPPTSEAAQAVYAPRLFLDYFANGVVRTFDYELVDEHPDPELTEPESDFGLVHYDFSPKPAFEAVANLVAILEDPGGGEFEPEKLGLRFGGNRQDLRHVLLQKADGTFYLALWRDGSVWDPETREEIQPGSAPITVGFGQPIAKVSEFQPNQSREALGTLPISDTGATEVRVGTRVVILELKP